MGMGVAHRRLTMGGPTGVGYAYRAAAVFAFGGMLQVAHLTLCLIHMQLVGTIDERHSRRVVTTIFQTMKSFYQDVEGITMPYVTYYSTHNLLKLWRQNYKK